MFIFKLTTTIQIMIIDSISIFFMNAQLSGILELSNKEVRSNLLVNGLHVITLI